MDINHSEPLAEASSIRERLRGPERQVRVDVKYSESMAEAISIMARLRGPGGCPWDREQTFDSIKRHTLEETYEVFDRVSDNSFIFIINGS